MNDRKNKQNRWLKLLVLLPLVMLSINLIGERDSNLKAYLTETTQLWMLVTMLGWVFVSLAQYFWTASASTRRRIVGASLLLPIPVCGLIFPYMVGLGYEPGNAFLGHFPGLLLSVIAVTIARPVARKIDKGTLTRQMEDIVA